MGDSSLSQTLQELKSEYGATELEVSKLRHLLNSKDTRLDHLRDAISALERLEEFSRSAENTPTNPQHGTTVAVEAATAEPDHEYEYGDGDPVTASIPQGSAILQYVARGGEGRRLRSTQMVTDVVELLDKVVTRDEVKEAFFQHFPREVMEILWDRPDNAFGNALSRAAKDKLIVRQTKGDTEYFASKAVLARISARRAEKAASNTTTATEDRER